MQDRRILRAHAHGRDGDWEAVCVDLDIAVQGGSFDEVRRLLDEAIATYVVDARREAPAEARRLLRRRAPLPVRIALATRYLIHEVWRGGRSLQAGFDIACPA